MLNRLIRNYFNYMQITVRYFCADGDDDTYDEEDTDAES